MNLSMPLVVHDVMFVVRNPLPNFFSTFFHFLYIKFTTDVLGC